MGELPESLCLHWIAISVTTDEKPGPGDAIVCLDCGHVMVFADDLTLRAPTDAEMYEMAGDQRLLRTQQMLAEFHEWEKKNPGNATRDMAASVPCDRSPPKQRRGPHDQDSE